MLVPAQIIALLGSLHFDPQRLASLECILSLGAPLLQEHKDRLNAALPGRFYELDGLAEGLLTILDREDAIRRSGSVGVPPPFCAVRIAHENRREAARNRRDRRPRAVPDGLLLRAAGSHRAAIRDGWLYSGDMGYLDDNGRLYLVDRKKDMIDSGGVKVYPRDLEDAARHSDISDVTVFGVPHDKRDEVPLAAVGKDGSFPLSLG